MCQILPKYGKITLTLVMYQQRFSLLDLVESFQIQQKVSKNTYFKNRIVSYLGQKKNTLFSILLVNMIVLLATVWSKMLSHIPLNQNTDIIVNFHKWLTARSQHLKTYMQLCSKIPFYSSEKFRNAKVNPVQALRSIFIFTSRPLPHKPLLNLPKSLFFLTPIASLTDCFQTCHCARLADSTFLHQKAHTRSKTHTPLLPQYQRPTHRKNVGS